MITILLAEAAALLKRVTYVSWHLSLPFHGETNCGMASVLSIPFRQVEIAPTSRSVQSQPAQFPATACPRLYLPFANNYPHSGIYQQGFHEPMVSNSYLISLN
jgi:hypothetical protein